MQFTLRWALERAGTRRAVHDLMRQRVREARIAPVSPAATDRELAEALAAHNPDALAHLYDRYGADAYGLALSLLGDITTAEQAVLTVFLTAWQMNAEGNAVPDASRRRLLDLVRQEATARRPVTATVGSFRWSSPFPTRRTSPPAHSPG